MELLHGDVTGQIIGAAIEVYRVLGYGFLEKVYHRALLVELRQRGLEVESEPDIHVAYKGQEVGHYRADLLVDGSVVVELKVSRAYCPEDEAQLINELKATGKRVGLLLNFGRNKMDFKRLVY